MLQNNTCQLKFIPVCISIAANILCMSASGNSIHVSVSVDLAYIQHQFFSYIGQQPLISLRVSAFFNLLYMSMLVELMHMSAPAYFAYISVSGFLIHIHY